MLKKLIGLYSPPLPAPHSWKDHGILPALFTVFLDYSALVLAAVVLAPIIIGGPQSSDGGNILQAFHFSHYVRSIIFAVAIGLYPLFQFFLAPVMGNISDRVGRKPILTATTFALAVISIITAVGIYVGTFSEIGIYIVLLCRIFMGIFSGNVGVTQSALTDYAVSKNMEGNVGLTFVSFGMMAATGSLCGALIGGIIPMISSFATAFIILGILYAVNSLWLWFFFSETLPKNKRNHKASLNPLLGITYISKAFLGMGKPLTFLFCSYIFYRIGWQFFVNFSQLYIITRFNPPHAETYIGALWIFGMIGYALLQYFINQPLNKLNLGKDKVMRLALLVEGGLLLGSSFIPQLMPAFLIVGVLGISANAFNSSNSAAAIASLAPKGSKGYVLGCAQAFQALAQLLAAIMVAFLSDLYIPLPVMLAGSFILLAGIILNLTYRWIRPYNRGISWN